MKNLIVLLSILLAIIGGTGAYVFSGTLMNSIYFACLAVFFLNSYKQYAHYYHAAPIELFNRKFIVFIVFIVFLLLSFLIEISIYSEYAFNSHEGTGREYGNLFRCFIAFLLTGVTYNIAKDSKVFIFIPIICLFIILTGLFLEVYDVIDFNADIEPYDSSQEQMTSEDNLLDRPGGFLNPNMSAALGLIWLFIALESGINTSNAIKMVALALTVTICILTQSRAAIVFFTLYSGYAIVIKRDVYFLTLLGIVLFCFIFYAIFVNTQIIYGLEEKFLERTASDNGSTLERLAVIDYGLKSFQNAPILGNGIYFVAKTEGHGGSTHNQTLEILVNFGFVGFLVMLALYITFYHKNNFSYMTLCILPTLIFSHNFFDDNAYQVAIAFAYYSINNPKWQHQ